MSEAATQVTLRLWIDADACPRIVKEVVFKTALRLQIPTTLVANQPIQVVAGVSTSSRVQGPAS